MLQVEPFDSCLLNQSQLYEDLSQIIKAFKSILTSMDNIANNLQKFESTSHLFQELKQTLKYLQGFVKSYSYPIGQESQHRNTFHRFICRLIESISAYKLKLQSNQYFSMLSSEVKQIEQIVMSYQQDKNIGLILKKIQNVVNKFCSKTMKNLQNSTKIPEEDKSYSKLGKKSQFTTITHEYQNTEDQRSKFSYTINEIKPKKVVQSRSENSLNKVMNLLNRRYKTLACLDIEYQEFKQLFFRSRDSKTQLYEDCFERNSFIYKEILRYSKQFSDYLQKRELKIFRKNKFVDSLGQNNVKVKNKFPSGKNDQTEHINYNFTKKKLPNTDGRRITDHEKNNCTEINSQLSSPVLMGRSQLIDDKFSNLVLIQHQQSGHISPQLIEQKRRPNILPLMINGNQFLDEKDKFQQSNGETFLQLSRRKKNLQLKKIDISLNNFGNGTGNQIQSAKLKPKFMNGETFKKTSVQTSKQMEQKINNSIRKNYLQKKYEQAMKKNANESLIQFQEEQLIQIATPSKHSSTKYIDFQQEGTPIQASKQRKYLIKTSNKRPINPGTQYKSLNPAHQRRQISTIKNFRKLKMDQTQKIQKLQKMKETALNHIEFLSGGKAIRPTFYHRQKQLAPNTYTEVTEEDFSDVNLGSHKQFQNSQRFY